MNTRILIAALACGSAVALGACSGGAPASPTAPGPTDPGTEDRTDAQRAFDTALEDAQKALAAARTNVTSAAALATAAETDGERIRATAALSAARKELADAVAAIKALTPPPGDVNRRGRAVAAATAADAALTADAAKLTTGEMELTATFAWYRQRLARYQLRNGEAAMPSEGGRQGANVKIERIPRTIDTSATDSTQIVNPAAFTSGTFKTVAYADGKEMFSVSGDEFKVEGYTNTDGGVYNRDLHTYAGLKLTREGIVIRTGGTQPADVHFSQWHTDYADTRRDITKYVNDNSPPHSRNGWDLVLTFGEPHTMSVPVGEPDRNHRSSWTGNGDFYWRSFVPAAPSQLETDGDYYDSRAFNQPDGYKDLGTYEVWLSNYVGVNANLEPVAGSGDNPHHIDDEPYYLQYAAYGLFVFTADRETFRDGSNGHKGRIQTMHLGYSAFADEDGKRTTDIGTAITSAKFRGQTLAHAFTGTHAFPDFRDSKLLRGDATLTVTIPETGSGTIEGDLENFEEWTGGRWKAFTTDFSVELRSAAITDAGTFSGSAAPTPSGRTVDFPARLPVGHGSYSLSGGLNGGGAFKGSFYGPRDDSADLEVAGSWTTGTGISPKWSIFGSFGAKQRPAEASGN